MFPSPTLSYPFPATPKIEHSEYQIRRLQVGTVSNVGTPAAGITWEAFDLAFFTLSFNQPIYVSEDRTGKTRRLGQNITDLTVEGAFHFECPSSFSPQSSSSNSGNITLSLEEDFPVSFWSAPTLGLYLPQSALNEFRDVLGVFDLFHDHTDVMGSSSACGAYGTCSHHTITLMLPLKRYSRWHPEADPSVSPPLPGAFTQTIFDEAVLPSCTLSYVPAAVRKPVLDARHAQYVREANAAKAAKAAKRKANKSAAAAAVLQTKASSKQAMTVGNDDVEEEDDWQVSEHPPSPARFANKHGQELASRVPRLEPATPLLTERSVMRLQPDASTRHASWSQTETALKNGDTPGAGMAVEGAGNSAEVAALLETETKVQGMVGLIMDPVVGGFVKSIIDLTSNLMMDAFGDHFTKKMYDAINTEVPPDVTMMLGTTLKANLSNVMTDSITFAVSKSLSDGFIRTFTPPVVDRMVEGLPWRIHAMLDRVLYEKIPRHVDEMAPKVIARGMTVTLIQGLTRSITHALVPTLTHALPHSANSDYYCYICATQADACHLCHFSALSVYYQVYYGTYYSDYYSNHYGNYYTHAVRKVDGAVIKKILIPGQELLPQAEKYLERANIELDTGGE